MEQDDVTKIKVNGHNVGIIGLKTAIEKIADNYAQENDEKLGEELLKRLRKHNHIPENVTESYKRAFVRKFRKSLNQPVEEEPSNGIEIKVLGPGCTQCNQMEKDLREIMAENNIVADIEHVRDIKEIAKYEVMGTPALPKFHLWMGTNSPATRVQ